MLTVAQPFFIYPVSYFAIRAESCLILKVEMHVVRLRFFLLSNIMGCVALFPCQEFYHQQHCAAKGNRGFLIRNLVATW